MSGMTVGVLAVQGAVAEHIETLESTFSEVGVSGVGRRIVNPPDLDGIDALIIPGGESTTISKLIIARGLYDSIRDLAGSIPVLGTCAGAVVMSSGIVDDRGKVPRLLELMDMTVIRNAFGPQGESFEADVEVDWALVPEGAGMEEGPYHAVFIRAPVITEVGVGCTPMASHDGMTVMALQGRLLVTSFHPELGDDTRVHRLLLDMV